ncbi:MAG TPA: aminoacyl-tRNA hydrolase [Phycisphaerales bacterium]|nr:aminoacyl-tRNA hydrolase [Phycisphaerales bacterium]
MKLLVGLGNPGSEYTRTRHNAGFLVLARLAERYATQKIARSKFHAMVLDASIGGEKCLLMKPMTYMNRSGQAVAEAVRFYKLDIPSDVLVIVDDVALPCGTIRLRAEGGTGGHNGLADIARKLGREAFPRLRVGIDSKPPMMRLDEYVLGRFTEEQREQLEPALTTAADAAEAFVTRGITQAMNTFNSRQPSAGPPDPKDEGEHSEKEIKKRNP